MSENNYVVSVRIGDSITAEFYAIKQFGENEKHINLLRVEETGELLCTHGSLFINLETNKVSVSYDVLNIVGSIISVKNNDGNVKYTVVTDLFKMDIYVCERNFWTEYGEEAF